MPAPTFHLSTSSRVTPQMKAKGWTIPLNLRLSTNGQGYNKPNPFLSYPLLAWFFVCVERGVNFIWQNVCVTRGSWIGYIGLLSLKGLLTSYHLFRCALIKWMNDCGWAWIHIGSVIVQIMLQDSGSGGSSYCSKSPMICDVHTLPRAFCWSYILYVCFVYIVTQWQQ